MQPNQWVKNEVVLVDVSQSFLKVIVLFCYK